MAQDIMFTSKQDEAACLFLIIKSQTFCIQLKFAMLDRRISIVEYISLWRNQNLICIFSLHVISNYNKFKLIEFCLLLSTGRGFSLDLTRKTKRSKLYGFLKEDIKTEKILLRNPTVITQGNPGEWIP